MRITRGDIASYAAFLGILLAGYLAAHHLPSTSGAEQSMSIGKVLEISGPTLDGGHFDLADHRGKVVLVDFWATWCGPCVAELPHIREAYDQYHDHGLDIVSVSLDLERSALVNFLKTKPVPWPQIFFDGADTRGVQNPLARRYGIQAIPCLLVIDREGSLVAQDVRGKQISAAIAEALGESISGTDRLAGGGLQVAGWFLHGFLAAPVWLVLLCAWGAATLAGLAEAVLRRSFPIAERIV
jgi:thiol-disulfide isomerase/thioredoxin